MRKHDPEMKGVIDQAYDLVQKILKWRNLRLEKSLHIKYEPSKSTAKTQFEAIMADVNDEVKQVEQNLKLYSISDSLSDTLAIDLGGIDVENIDLTWEEKDTAKVKADKEYKKKLREEQAMKLHLDTKSKS